MKIQLVCLVAIFFFTLTSCHKQALDDFANIDEIETGGNWNPTFIISVIDTAFYLKDYLGEVDEFANIEVLPDGLLCLKYSDEVHSPTGEELVEFPDFNIPVLGKDYTAPASGLPLDFVLSKADLKGGKMRYSFSNPIADDLTVVLKFPSLMRDGIAFQKELTVSGHQQVDGQIDLNAYLLDLSSGMFTVGYEATKNSNGEHISLTDLVYSMSNLAYHYVQGTFDQLNYELPSDSIDFDFYADENVEGGSLFLEDPVIRLHFKNSFGIPVELKTDEIMVGTHHGGDMRLTSDLDHGFDFEYPQMSEMGSFQSSSFLVNDQNSNFTEIIASNPYKIAYALSATSNLSNAGPEGFIMDDSQFFVNMDVELPLWFRLETVSFEVVEDFDPSDIDFLEEATFNLSVENGLPINGALQVYFEDDRGNVLDVLLPNDGTILRSGEVNSDGRVTSPTIHETEVIVDEERLEAISNATKVRFVPTVSTTNGGSASVKIFEDYRLGFRLGIKATIN